MNSKHVVFALGALDPEMRSIRSMLGKAGYRCAFANRFGRRCNSSNAYQADELSKVIKAEQQIIWVECRAGVFNQNRDVIVDHHNEGDPGYASPPSEFWYGSSVGQIAQLIGAKQEHYKLAAAGDHCLSAAMRGECPGINPHELMAWRVSTRADMNDLPHWLLKRMIDRAVERIGMLPRIDFGGVSIVDGSFDTTPELRDAAALLGVPLITTRKSAAGHVKVGLYGGRPETVSMWMDMMRKSSVVVQVYGNPFREYAGAILDVESSDRLIQQCGPRLSL